MIFKISVLFVVCVVKNGNLAKNFSTEISRDFSSPEPSKNYRVSIVEKHLLLAMFEAREALKEEQATIREEIMNETIDEMKKQTLEIISTVKQEMRNQLGAIGDTIKQEMTDEMENQLSKNQEKLKQEIKIELIETGDKIKQSVDEIKNQLNETQNIIVRENSASKQKILDQLDIEKKTIIFENQKLESNVEKNLTNKLTTIKKELSIDIRDPFPTDCRDLQKRGIKTSGVYRIKPRAAISDFLVYCDLTTQGGGWAYVVNRINGSQNFYLNWIDYKIGFGKILGEHWLGLEHLYELTNSEPYELLFDFLYKNKQRYHANYDDFKIGPESDGYSILVIGNQSGTLGDVLSYHKGMKFTTKDRDQDQQLNGNCARDNVGAWWYKNCLRTQLTGTHKNSGKSTIIWNGMTLFDEAKMMIRPRTV